MTEFNFERRKIAKSFPDSVAVKWSPLVLDEGFVPFPKRLLRCVGDLFKGEHALEDLTVVLSIVDYLRPKMERGPSIDFLAFNAGLDRPVFVDRLRALEKRGFVGREGPDEAVSFDLSGLMEAIEKKTKE